MKLPNENWYVWKVYREHCFYLGIDAAYAMLKKKMLCYKVTK